MGSNDRKSANRVRNVYIGGALTILALLLGANLAVVLSADGPTGFATVIEPGGQVAPYSLILFEDSGVYFARDGNSGAIRYTDSNATYVVQSALEYVASLANLGTVFFKSGPFYVDTLTLPASAVGYCLRGEFHATNDISHGARIVATSDTVGDTMVSLNQTPHSNNIQIFDLTFSDGGHAVDILLNMSQTASQSSRFVIDNCMFYGQNVADRVIDLDNNEDLRLSRCVITCSSTQTALVYRVPGGFGEIASTTTGGQYVIAGLSILMDGCLIGAGGVNVSANIANCNIVMTGCWIESTGAYQPFIRGYNGVNPIFLTVTGGRWNTQDNYAFIKGCEGAFYVSATGLTISCNDAKYADFIDNDTAVNTRYSRDMCTALSGACFNAFLVENRGIATISSGLSYIWVEHSIWTTPVVVLVAAKSYGLGNFTITDIGAVYFKVQLDFTAGDDTPISWYAASYAI